MSENRSLNDAVAEPESLPLETTKSTELLKELKNDHEAALSVTLECVLKESAIVPVPDEKRNRPETPPQMTSMEAPINSSSPPPLGAGENKAPSDDISPMPTLLLQNTLPSLTDAEETESSHPLEGKHPTTLDTIPEHTNQPTPNISERESPSHTTMAPIPTENKLTPDPSLLPAKLDGESTGRYAGIGLAPVETCPLSEKVNSASLEDIDTRTPAMVSSERLSIVTAIESSSLGSSNDIFISTKTSTENTIDTKLEAESEPTSNQALIALQKIMPPNLGEDAKHIFLAATEKLFKDPKIDLQNFDTMPFKSSPDVEQTSTQKADILKIAAVKSSVSENLESVEEGCKVAENYVPLHLSKLPVHVDSVDEPIIDLDTSLTEVHTDPTEFQANRTEDHSSPTETPHSPNEAHSSPNEDQCSPSEAHRRPNEAQSSPNEAQSNPNEAHSSPNEAHSSPNEAHSSPNEAHSSPNEAHSSPNEAHSSLTKAHSLTGTHSPTVARTTCASLSEIHSSRSEIHTRPAESFTNPAEVHMGPAEVNNNQTDVQISLPETHTGITEVHINLPEAHTSSSELQTSRNEPQAMSTEVHVSLTKVHSSPAEACTTSSKEVHTNETETHAGPTAIQIAPVELRKNTDLERTLSEISQPEPTPAPNELEAPRLEHLPVEILKDTTENSPTSTAPLPSKEQTTEVPIQQSDTSKDPAKKQTSKTAVKIVKPVKTAIRAPSNPQVVTSGQAGAIAATTSASATSALSPRSEKNIKQIKSSRPASATSARGFHSDLSSPNLALGGMTASLTGPQRVAAARAAASAAGLKRKGATGAASSVLADGIRSPREKQSVISTNSTVMVTGSNNSASSTIQKRTSAVSGSSATSALHSNIVRRGALSDGHRASGHGGPPQLGIHGPHQKLKPSNDIKSLEDTYSAVLKSFADAKKEIQLKTKLAVEMFSEVERLRHIASTKFGKDLPLTENVTGLAAAVTRPATGAGEQMVSDEDNRAIAIAEAILKSLTLQRTSLLNEAMQHHANLLACCCEATGDEGSPMLFSEKEFADRLPARLSEAASAEQSRVAEILRVLRTSLSDLDETKACIRNLRSQLELLDQENSTMTSSLADCTKELEESRSEFGKTTARRMAAEKETKILRLKLKDAETKVAAEEQKCKDLSNQVRSLEDKLRSKDSTVEQRMKEAEKKMRERVTKELEDNQRRLAESLKEQQLKERKLEVTCRDLESNLENVKKLLAIRTNEKERVEEELRATSEKLSRTAIHRPAETEITQSEREDILQRLQAMIAGEDISTGPNLREELKALADLLNERDRLITEKDSEINRLKDSNNESGDTSLSKEDFLELQQTLTMLATHNQNLEQELSKMQQAAAKRDRVMSEQERVLVIRDQLIALLQSSNHPAGNVDAAGVNANPVAMQKKMLELQTTVECQTVRIKALEAQLTQTEEHQDGLQNLRTRYERRIAQLEHALSDNRVTHRSMFSFF